MRLRLVFLLGLSGVCFTSAADTDCVDGIETAVSYLTFNGSAELSYYVNMCSNDLVVLSLWAAAKVYCTPQEIQAGYDEYNPICQEYGSVALTPYAEVEPKLTNDYLNSLPVAEFSDVQDFTLFDTPVMISSDLYKAARDTSVRSFRTSMGDLDADKEQVDFSYEYVLHQRYGWGFYGFWGGILLIGVINRLVTHFSQSRRLKATGDVEGNSKAPTKKQSGVLGLVNSTHHWLRANIIIPAAFGSHHNRPVLWSTIPTRMESIVLFAFWALTLILCCVGYYIFWPNLYYTKPQQGWRYIADRTGILSYALLPWLWMFSGRNNVFLWLTGWSFATFNVFHRHIARAATILAIVHSINWSVLESNLHYYASQWEDQYWWMGAMATVTMSLIVFFSSMFFRVKSYEFFLLIHIGLSIITLVGLYYHTIIFDGEYDGYLWPPVAIWCFDRFVRIVRWAYCNIHVKTSRSIVGTKTCATYDKDSDLIRLEIVPGSTMLKPGPGQHYYLYQPLKFKGWENHPFTLGAYEPLDSPPATQTAAADTPEVTTKEIHVGGVDSSSHDNASSSSSSGVVAPLATQHKQTHFENAIGQQKFIFLVRPFGSWTKRLRAECLKSPTGVITPSIFIEGPYGERSPLHTYENVVFIVGGTGISGALPYLQEHIQRTDSSADTTATTTSALTTRATASTTRTRDITFVWSAKQAAMIRNVAARELQPMLGRDDIHVHLHATSSSSRKTAMNVSEAQGKNSNDSDTADAAAAADDKEIKTTTASATTTTASSLNNDGLTITHGRPNIREAILNVVNEVHAAGTAGGRIAILTCGPAGMADEARAAVHTALKQGMREVEYIEETFGW